MTDDQERVAEKVLDGVKKLEEKQKSGKCNSCGAKGPDNIFNCETCGKEICTECYNMTMEAEMICQDCITTRGLTSEQLQF